MKHLYLIATVLCLTGLRVSADSLWISASNPERGMTADKKASRRGDILTVVVDESANTSSSQSKTTNKGSNIDAGISQFLFPPAVSGLGTHAGALPSTKLSSKSDTSGGGAIANTQSLTARAAVTVSDVLPNGNLVIEGVRVVTFSGETQYVVLHGVVRSDDISETNTIASTNVADARVEFISEGALTDAQKKGWMTKIYDTLRPY